MIKNRIASIKMVAMACTTLLMILFSLSQCSKEKPQNSTENPKKFTGMKITDMVREQLIEKFTFHIDVYFNGPAFDIKPCIY